MSFTNFYLVAGGTGAADINAGFTTGAAQATTTNGNWNSGTGAFAATGGTPFASTVIGDYASIYVDSATVTTYVAKVKTVTDSTHIVVDTTIAYGTAPSTSANARTCTINGAWNSEIVLAATGLGTTTVPQSTKINIKGNLTVTANRTISMAGATTTPLWFSGYNTNPGDLDNDTTNTLAKPVWTFNSTISLTSSGTYQVWSGISLAFNRNGSGWTTSGAQMRMSRMRVANTNSGTGTYCVEPGSATRVNWQYCYFNAPSTPTTSAMMSSGGNSTIVGCVFDGGGSIGQLSVNGTQNIVNCLFINGAAGILPTSTQELHVIGCSFVTMTTDGIKWASAPGAGSHIVGCIFSGGAGTLTNGINNSTGTNTANVVVSCCDFFNVTNATVGLGDMPTFFGQTDTNNPLTSATNLTPRAGSKAWFNGFPGIFENETFNGYTDIGAVQHIAPSGLFIQ